MHERTLFPSLISILFNLFQMDKEETGKSDRSSSSRGLCYLIVYTYKTLNDIYNTNNGSKQEELLRMS